MTIKKKIVTIYDGWKNVLTGLGEAGKDKRTGAILSATILTKEDVSELYDGDDIAKKVVDILPYDGIRKGFEIMAKDMAQAQDIKKVLKDIGFLKKIHEAWRWARLYGGSAILLSTSDGENTDQELNYNNIQSLNALTVLTKYELEAVKNSITKDAKSKNFGLPELYRLKGERVDEKGSREIHYTRLIRFNGSELSIEGFIKNGYWHDSILSRLYNVLRNFNLAHDTLPTIVQEFTLGMLKLKDISDMLASGESEKVLNRLLAFDMQKSSLRSFIIDQDEEYKRDTINVSGLDKLLDVIENRLVSATGLPHTIILGDSPTGGMSGKGESENRDYYDTVASHQEAIIREPIEQIIKIYMLSRKGITKGKELEDWNIKFNPLWQMDDKEIVEIRKIQAETDNLYIGNGVIDPQEITASRFEGEEYSIETKVDNKTRLRQKDLDLEQKAKEEETD
ncbi:MAG: DUF1073 domain-containing protein [Bacteroidetes bacterium]|nr:DUF1073 domain-containing protein [Bacteroidota bacterium]